MDSCFDCTHGSVPALDRGSRDRKEGASASAQALDAMVGRMARREPIVAYRFDCGTLAFVRGMAVEAGEWRAPAGRSRLGHALKTILDTSPEAYAHYGIPCPDCSVEGHAELKEWITLGNQRANLFPDRLFVDANYRRFMAALPRFWNAGPVVLVANERASFRQPMDPIVEPLAQPMDWLWVTDDVVTLYEENEAEASQGAREFAAGLPARTLVLSAAGPLSGALLFFMHQARPDLTYVDVGTALDESLYGKKTRSFMTAGMVDAGHACSLPEDPPAAPRAPLAVAASRVPGRSPDPVPPPRSPAPPVQTPTAFAVWLVAPPHHEHVGALAELARSTHSGLVKIGKASSLTVSPTPPALSAGHACIVLGVHLLRFLPAIDLPEGRVILYNAEAYGTPPFEHVRPHLLAHRSAWDYSADNAALLKKHLGIDARFVPPGFDEPSFNESDEAQKDIDVLFYGSVNDRRRRTLDALRAEGLRVHEFQLPYGSGRDAFIRRAKVVLNLHHYEDPGLFEAVRVAHLLNNGALVVSEGGLGQYPYDQAAVCVPYDALVPVCRDYVQRVDLRTARARLGPAVMRQFLDTPTLLAHALPAEEPPPPTLCLVVLGKDTAAFDGMDFHAQARREADELVLIKTEDARFGGLSEIANRVARRTRCAVVGVVHADTTFGDGALTRFARSAARGQVAGLVGITIDREYVWSKSVSAGTERRVSTLDGCSVFFPTAFLKENPRASLAFDERFASFHCGVEDFCLHAGQAMGVPVVVPAAEADHHSGERGTYLRPEWQEAYWKDRKVLGDKWPHLRFETT